MKGKFILKPIRKARGTGVLVGKDTSVDQWESILRSMQSPGLSSQLGSALKVGYMISENKLGSIHPSR